MRLEACKIKRQQMTLLIAYLERRGEEISLETRRGAKGLGKRYITAAEVLKEVRELLDPDDATLVVEAPTLSGIKAYLAGDTDVPPNLAPPAPGQLVIQDAVAECPVIDPPTEEPGLVIVEPDALPVRLTWGEIASLAEVAKSKTRLSVSQVDSMTTCALRYLIKRGGKCPEEVPSWWFIGGVAVHAAIECIAKGDDRGAVEIFIERFQAQVSALEHSSKFPIDEWKAAKRGVEGEAYWRSHGPEMVNRWKRFRDEMAEVGWSVAKNPGDEPMVEYAFEQYIGSSRYSGYVDQVLVDQDGARMAIDLKSGSSKPTSDFQLKAYCAALGASKAGYLMLRTGELIQFDYSERWSEVSGEVSHTFGDLTAMVKAGLYPARRSGECFQCPARDVCPTRG